MPTKNIFCQLEDLHNEADVEQRFICRLLSVFQYPDEAIRPKDSLSNLVIGGMRGMPQGEYRPDFALKKQQRIRWIIEAKKPDESLDRHVWQPKGYCMLLNGEFSDSNPTKYYLLTNGRKTRLYKWDRNACELELDFTDFIDGNSKYEQLKRLVSWSNLDVGKETQIQHQGDFCIVKESLSEVNAAFAWCHQHIYKKDNISQGDAFSEFVKLVALKLMSDKQIKNKHPEALAEKKIYVSSDEVKFSTRWIDSQVENSPNPMSDIQFNAFVSKMEAEIARGERKRFFDKGERINLKSETIYGVVQKLEKMFLFGIDADLNGRLFETFLNATMRGKDLGQFFTPRSLVKLGVGLAQLKVHVRNADGIYHTDSVIDACCGTGGFLIDIFAEMLNKVDAKTNLSKTEKDEIKDNIRKKYIVGIDIGKSPNLSRVARLNMYLHGDGGTRIFNVDALDKEPQVLDTDEAEIIKEKEELQNIFANHQEYFDVAITNPPFAKVYERILESEKRILDQYIIGKDENGNARASVKSSLLFIERYYDLLKPGGRLITVIDDGILSGREYVWFRTFIRDKFLVRAVISMPGDAFQRSKARVKTSFVILEKRNSQLNVVQEQAPIFMYACKYVGNDDPSRQRTLPIDALVREKAKEEIEDVCTQYNLFCSGQGNPKYIVAPEKIHDRLDVKNCLLTKGRSVPEWKEKGYSIYKVSDVLQQKVFEENNIINTKDNGEVVKQIIVRYNGDIDEGEEINACDSQYSKLFVVNTGDLVISNIAASYGSIAVVPEELDGCVVSNEYTVLQAKNSYDVKVIKCILRSPEIRSEILLSSTGSNRTRMQWESLKDISIIYPNREIEKEMCEAIEYRERLENELKRVYNQEAYIMESNYNLANDEAIGILEAFKPPK